MKRTAPGLFVVLVFLASCSAAGGTPGTSPGGSSSDPPASSQPPSTGGEIEHPTGSEAILVVSSQGGMVPVAMQVTNLPTFVLLGDGRVIMQGMQTLEFPGPALPVLIERTLTEAGIQAVLDAVEETNLFTSDLELRGGMAMCADCPDTVFTLHAADRDVTVVVSALGQLGPDMGNMEGIDPAEIEAHQTLSQLNEALMTIDTSVPTGSWEAEGWQPYEPEAFRLYVRDASGQPVEGGDLPEQVREWPTDDDPASFGEEQPGFGDGTRCGVVEGDLAATWLDELNAATQMTLWTTDGENRFAVQARPVLPNEDASCPEMPGS